MLYKQYGSFDATLIKKLTGGSFDNIIKYHIWEQEVCAKLCTEQSHKLESIIETITGVIDVKDMKLSQITNDFLTLTKLLAEIDQKQYPETLGRIFIINVPSVFPFVWRMVKPWLDPATAAKIEIYAGPKEYEPALKNFIGEDNLPSNYGGKLAALSTEVHPYASYVDKVKASQSIVESSKPVLDEEEEKAEQLHLSIAPSLTSHNHSIDGHSPRNSRRKGFRKRPGSAGLRRLMNLDITSDLYPYPANTPGYTNEDGHYLHKMNPVTEEILLNTIKKGLEEKLEFLHLCSGCLHPTLTLLRYLRANAFDTMKAIEHMKKNIAWRKENQVDKLLVCDPEEILGCKMEQLTAVFPHWQLGNDKTGRYCPTNQYFFEYF